VETPLNIHEMSIPTMHESKCFTARFYINCAWLCLVLAANSAWADAETWQSLSTKYTVIHFQSDRDLELFNLAIDYSLGGGFKALFGGSGGKDFSAKLTKKIDDLFARVQEILDMRKYMHRVQINIYSDKEKLQEVYRREVKTRGEYRAWYLFERNTIYLQVEDVNEGMLAHEMAHAIIDNFFQVRPPPASAEILARYVDAHLND
jgi:hypothetical protein